MTVDRAWVERNLGFDPITRPAPAAAFAIEEAAKPRSGPEDMQREIIDFDSEAPAGMAFLAFRPPRGYRDSATSHGRKGLRRRRVQSRAGTAVASCHLRMS